MQHRSGRLIPRLVVAAIVTTMAVVTLPWSASAQDPSVRQAQWWLDVLRAETVWSEHTRGEGIVVAVLDSGVDPSGDLEGAVLPGFLYDGTGRGDSDSHPYHGTMMASLIAGRGTGRGIQGIAPEATILPVRMTDSGDARQATQALQTLAAMDDPPDIVNMSFVSSGTCPTEMQAAVVEAIEAGMLLVAGTGNLHRDGVTEDTPMSPASCAGVVAVGAYGWAGTNHPNGEPDLRLWDQSQWADYQTLVAPGQDMLAFMPGESGSFTTEGTSDATAVAAGSLALVRAANPDLDARQVVTRVIATARPLSTIGTGDDTPTTKPIPGEGYGAVRPFQAITADVPDDAANPVFDRLDDLTPTETTESADDAVETESEATTNTDDEDSSSGTSSLVLIVGGVAAVVILASAALVIRGRRS